MKKIVLIFVSFISLLLCINKVNEGKGVSYIDFAIKDDQLDDVITAMHDIKSENPKYIAKRIKKQFGM